MNDKAIHNILYTDKTISAESPFLYMQMQRIRVDKSILTKARDMLIQSIPLYWEQDGIEDVRVMESREMENTFVIISHWQSKAQATTSQDNGNWTLFNRQWELLLLSGKIEILESITDHYELIE